MHWHRFCFSPTPWQAVRSHLRMFTVPAVWLCRCAGVIQPARWPEQVRRPAGTRRQFNVRKKLNTVDRRTDVKF